MMTSMPYYSIASTTDSQLVKPVILIDFEEPEEQEDDEAEELVALIQFC
jgi:hypothetical protein